MAQGRSTQIISMIKWIWTNRLSIKNSLSTPGRRRPRLVFKADRLVFHSTLGSSVIKKSKEKLGTEGLGIALPGKANSNFHGARPVHSNHLDD